MLGNFSRIRKEFDSMKPSVQLAIIALIVVLVGAWMFFTYFPLPSGSGNNGRKVLVADSMNKMKRLWTERSYLTRAANIEELTGYHGSSITKERLMANSGSIGRTVGHLYGPEAGEAMSHLLHDYHEKMITLIRLARERKDLTDAEAAVKRSGEAVVELWGKVCPTVDVSKLHQMFVTHNQHFIENVLQIIRDENVGAMASFDSFNKNNWDIICYLDDCVWDNMVGSSPRHF